MTATIIPISTNTTIATCIQIQVGDMREAYFDLLAGSPAHRTPPRDRRGRAPRPTIVASMHGPLLRRAPVAFTLCVLAALAAGAGSAGASSAQTAPGALSGVNIPGLGLDSQPQEADRVVAYARRLHVDVLRADVPWAVMEPHARGVVDPSALAFTDRLVSDASAAHIQLVATVDDAPCWASSAPSSLLARCRADRLGSANAWPPRDPAAYAEFVAYLASRYGSQLAAIEVWNEPDQANEDYFAGPEKARRYTAVVRAAYPAIKQANPSVAVLAGSLVGSNGVFLRALYAAGMKGYYDGLSVHFYNLTLASLRSIHEAQRAGGDATPLWLDEFGWTSCWPRRRVQQQQGCVTAATQAVNLADTFGTLAHTSWVRAAIAYKLQDSPGESFGLLDSGGVVKAAFKTLARLLPALRGATSPVTVSLRLRGSHVLAGGSAPVGDFMMLEAFRGKLLRYRAVFTLDRFNRFSIALPAALGTRGLRVTVYQYWTGPARAAQKSI